jgi:hypothetical protein
VDIQTAQLILYAVTVLAAVVWLSGLRFLVASARMLPSPSAEQLDFDDAPPPTRICGTTEVESEPTELASKAAIVLAKGSIGPLGQLRIVERTEDRVIFDGTVVQAGNPALGQYVRRGELRFTSATPGRTRIDYAVEVCSGRGLLWGGAVFQILGLIALVAGFWLIRTYVVPNPNPAVRGQTLQMLQVCHFLWPPFLFAGLYRKRHNALRSALATFAQNMPYYEG